MEESGKEAKKTHGESAVIGTDAFACCTELGTALSFPELPPPTLEANAPVVKRTPRARYSFGILRPRMRLLFSYFFKLCSQSMIGYKRTWVFITY